jgi:hypothetical protein
MGTTNRALRLVTAMLTVWCLNCDAFEAIAESLLDSRPLASVAGSVESPTSDHGMPSVTGDVLHTGLEATDACHCVLGHAAVVSVASTNDRIQLAPADFGERPRARVLPAPEPLLRPPVA